MFRTIDFDKIKNKNRFRRYLIEIAGRFADQDMSRRIALCISSDILKRRRGKNNIASALWDVEEIKRTEVRRYFAVSPQFPVDWE